MSSALIGCLVGAISAGTLSDKLGRKRPLIFAAALLPFLLLVQVHQTTLHFGNKIYVYSIDFK